MPHMSLQPSLIYPILPQLPTYHALALAPPFVRLQGESDYHADHQVLSQGMFTSVHKKYNSSVDGCMMPQNFEASRTQFHSSILLLSASVPSFYRYRASPYIRLLEKYLLSTSQMFSSIGADNPSHNRMRKIEFRLSR